MVAGAPCSHHPPHHGRETMIRSSVLTPAQHHVAVLPAGRRLPLPRGRGMSRPMGRHLDRARGRRSDRGERGQRANHRRSGGCVPRTGRPCTEVHDRRTRFGRNPSEKFTRERVYAARRHLAAEAVDVRPTPAVARGVVRCLQSLSGAEVASGSCRELPRDRAGARRPSWGF